MKKQTSIPLTSYKAGGGFISDFQKLIREAVIPYQYSVLCDEADTAEKSHVIKNFINAAAALRKEDTHLVNRMGGNLIELKHVLAKIYEIAGIEDENLDTSKRSDEKASPNIID